MPRYQIIEKRAYYEGVVIDAESEEAALMLEGEVVANAQSDGWLDAVHAVEEVAPDTDEVELP